MIASLPMYDRAETAPANDRLWMRIRDGLRAAGGAAPEALTRGGDLWDHWLSPDLVLSQTCGFPYRTRLHGKVTLIGTPEYGLPGCPPGHYCSVFVARADDPRQTLSDFDGASLAYNEAQSQSGWAAPQTHAAGLGLRLRPGVQTGAHALSAQAVADGKADLAALDAVTWGLISRWDAVAAGLRVVAVTDPTPGLPLIARAGADAVSLRCIVADAIAAMPDADRDATGLRGLVLIAPEAYLAVPTPPAPDCILSGQ